MSGTSDTINGWEKSHSCARSMGVNYRNGLVVDVVLWQATGTVETEAALTMLERVPTARRITVGADKGYDTGEFVTTCRSFRIAPHVAMKQRHSALDRRTSRHAGYAASQRVRKRV